MDHLPGHQAVLCLLTDKIDRDVIDLAKECGVRGFANLAVGYDNIDVRYAAEKGILVTNTPGILTQTTAELAWALLFAASRRTSEADRFCRAGKFTSWKPLLFLGMDVSGKTLGIIGAGRIGTAMALMSKGFKMKVLYADVKRNEILETELNAEKVSLDELLTRSDFISIHTPLTPETRRLIGEREFSLMKRDAILVNTSRGAVLDEEALARALKNGTIHAAGLDVYEKEPAIHPDLFHLENVVLLPHIGSATLEIRGKMSLMAAQNILAMLLNQSPPNLIHE
jgi:glyoxylate reductase